jgi:predicted nucleic acid-binding protein
MRPTDGPPAPSRKPDFVRVSSNQRIIQPSLTPSTALKAMELLVAHPNHVFWPDSLSASQALNGLSLSGYRQVTDAYLVGLANRNGGQLVTFDRGIPQISADVLVIPTLP